MLSFTAELKIPKKIKDEVESQLNPLLINSSQNPYCADRQVRSFLTCQIRKIKSYFLINIQLTT